ncbi:MAG: hypothetical protein GF401_13195 [Chitinivibrionales bacterium]|nr:hypothetical protein [Chitinivibrionales bacterium]
MADLFRMRQINALYRNAVDKRRSISGVTLAELMIIIVIAAILAVVAVPNLGRMLSRIHTRNSVNEIKSTLALAQARAIANPRVHCGVYFNTSDQKMLIFFDDNENNHYDSGADRIYKDNYSLDKSTKFILTSVPNDVVIFRGDGSAKNGATIQAKDTKYNQTKTITVVKQSGKIQIQ